MSSLGSEVLHKPLAGSGGSRVEAPNEADGVWLGCDARTGGVRG